MKIKSSKGIGIALIVLSGVFWLLIPGVHLFDIPGWWKAAIDAVLLIAAEIAFWIGSILLGREFMAKLKKIPGIKELWRRIFNPKGTSLESALKKHTEIPITKHQITNNNQ
jgi:hypothetical protein